MMTAFDPSIAENYSRVFDEPAKVKQTQLRFSEPVHYTPGVVIIKNGQETHKKVTVKQQQLGFSEPLHYM